MTNIHTFKNFRKELYQPIIEERDNFENWKRKGSLSIEQVANKKWKEILAKYEEPSLPAETDQALRDYIKNKYGE